MTYALALDKNVSAHHFSEVMRIQRAVSASNLGLPPEAFALPFPGNTTNLTVQNPAPKSGGWLPALLGAIAATAIGYGAYSLLPKATTPTTPTQPVQIAPAIPSTDWDSDIRMEVIPPPEKN